MSLPVFGQTMKMPTSGASASRRWLAMRWRLAMAAVMSCRVTYLASVEDALDSFFRNTRP